MDQSQPPMSPPPMSPPPPQMPPPPQPQWTPPPQQPTGNWGQPGYGGPPPRPVGVTLASIYLLVMGVLIALVGGCSAAFGGLLGSAATNSTGTDSSILGGAGTFFAGLGIVILVIGILSIVGGAGAMAGRGWGRWLGVVVSIIFAILLILGGLGGLTNSNGLGGGLVSLVIGGLYALTAWALLTAGAYFSYRR